MPEASTRAAALMSGQVDFVEAPSPDAIPRLKVGRHAHHHAALSAQLALPAQLQKGPFTDVRVRQAANYAINRDEMVDMLGGVAMEGYGVFTPSQAFYGNPVKYNFDTKKANALLKEANCLPCNITLGISTSGSGQMQPLPMNELVKAQLEAAGFKVKFETMDWNTLLATFWAGWREEPELRRHQLQPVRARSGLRASSSTSRPPTGAGRPQLGLVLRTRSWMSWPTRSQASTSTRPSRRRSCSNARDGRGRRRSCLHRARPQPARAVAQAARASCRLRAGSRT